jgi:hypothetical protein
MRRSTNLFLWPRTRQSSTVFGVCGGVVRNGGSPRRIRPFADRLLADRHDMVARGELRKCSRARARRSQGALREEETTTAFGMTSKMTKMSAFGAIRDSRIATRRSVGISTCDKVGSQGLRPSSTPASGLAAIRESRIWTRQSVEISVLDSSRSAGVVHYHQTPANGLAAIGKSRIATRQSV